MQTFEDILKQLTKVNFKAELSHVTEQDNLLQIEAGPGILVEFTADAQDTYQYHEGDRWTPGEHKLISTTIYGINDLRIYGSDHLSDHNEDLLHRITQKSIEKIIDQNFN